MKFFSMFWERQTDEMKEKIRGLVKNGQLEFINAGWSMHDEACTHYEDMINNMMIGHEFLEREFDGYKPKVGWHIDPFGHSNANPRLFAEMGIDAWFFARIDYEDKEKRLKDKTMQWIWKPFSESLGDQVSLFTHTMHNHYCYPRGFAYDVRYDDDNPVVSDESLETFNARFKSLDLYEYILEMTLHYEGNHFLIPWGCDFSFSNAYLAYHSPDNLIKYFNSHFSDMTLMYSTPSEYLDALKSQDITFSVRYDDMFPYADRADDYWTGYFTSRALAKKMVREA